MNIFYLDSSPLKAAQYHCDDHVGKMILESAQMLSTVVRLKLGAKTKVTAPDGKVKTIYLLPGETYSFKKVIVKDIVSYKLETSTGIYIQTHINHPCVVWLGQSIASVGWILCLVRHLNDECKFRYNNGDHLSYTKILSWNLVGRLYGAMQNIPFTPPPQCMPENFRCDDTVEAYRRYYAGGKQHLHSWTKRGEPGWLVINNSKLNPSGD